MGGGCFNFQKDKIVDDTDLICKHLQINRTRNQIILTKESGRVTKILTASRILQILIALCQIKAKIHSFPTMYIIGGGKFGLTR